jgi:hypothetical protein
VEAAARQGEQWDSPLCIAEEGRERREAGSGERNLGRRGRRGRISGERGEGGTVGTRAPEEAARRAGEFGVEETSVRRNKLDMRKNSGSIDHVVFLRSKSNDQDLLWTDTLSSTRNFICSIDLCLVKKTCLVEIEKTLREMNAVQ